VNEVAFVRQREPDWKRLTALCDRADVSPKSLKPEELKEIIRLYRQTSGDLALARTQSGNLQLVEFLNDLVGRSYVTLYRSNRGSVIRAIGEAIQTFAAVSRRRKWFLYAAAITFFIGAFVSGFTLNSRPDLRRHFVQPGMEENFRRWQQGLTQRSGEESLQMTGFYMANNPFVAIITSAVAASTFGLVTVQLLWNNGVLLGALGHDMHDVGKLGYLLGNLAPHGVTEIQGIFVAGGAGYLMGWTLFFPGRRRRGDALRDAVKDALVLICGGTVMMFIAAPFEGFFSFDPSIPTWLKAVVATGIAGGWYLFYRGVGRHLDPPKVVTEKRQFPVADPA